MEAKTMVSIYTGSLTISSVTITLIRMVPKALVLMDVSCTLYSYYSMYATSKLVVVDSFPPQLLTRLHLRVLTLAMACPPPLVAQIVVPTYDRNIPNDNSTYLHKQT